MNKGVVSSIWKVHTTVLPFVGLFGIGIMYGLLPKAAVVAQAANPHANLLDTLIQMWSMMATNVIDFAIPGGAVIADQIGTGITSIFSGAASILPAAPAVSLHIPTI